MVYTRFGIIKDLIWLTDFYMIELNFYDKGCQFSDYLIKINLNREYDLFISPKTFNHKMIFLISYIICIIYRY